MLGIRGSMCHGPQYVQVQHMLPALQRVQGSNIRAVGGCASLELDDGQQISLQGFDETLQGLPVLVQPSLCRCQVSSLSRLPLSLSILPACPSCSGDGARCATALSTCRSNTCQLSKVQRVQGSKTRAVGGFASLELDDGQQISLEPGSTSSGCEVCVQRFHQV